MINLFFRRIIGKIARIFSPGYGACYRCNRPWNICKGHLTSYNKFGGCFPLCEECWSELTIAERIPYYIRLWDSWRYGDHSSVSWNEVWKQIYAAVMEGG